MATDKIATIDVHELKKRRDADPQLCLIDVREWHEWQTSRIPGALHIPKDELLDCIETHIPDLQTPIYLHCKSGMRSLYAANALMGIGYNVVYSVDGGIIEWEQVGYPIENE